MKLRNPVYNTFKKTEGEEKMKMKIFTIVIFTAMLSLMTGCGTTHIIIPDDSESTDSSSVIYVTPVGDMLTKEAVTEPVTDDNIFVSESTYTPDLIESRFYVSGNRITKALYVIKEKHS